MTWVDEAVKKRKDELYKYQQKIDVQTEINKRETAIKLKNKILWNCIEYNNKHLPEIIRLQSVAISSTKNIIYANALIVRNNNRRIYLHPDSLYVGIAIPGIPEYHIVFDGDRYYYIINTVTGHRSSFKINQIEILLRTMIMPEYDSEQNLMDLAQDLNNIKPKKSKDKSWFSKLVV